MHNNSLEIQDFINAAGGALLVQVETFQDGFLRATMDDLPIVDFAVAHGVFAWKLPDVFGTTRGIYAQHVRREDDELWIWREWADNGSGLRVRLSPIWLPEQRLALKQWAPIREPIVETLATELATQCENTNNDEALHSVPHEIEHTYLVSRVDRAPVQEADNAGLEMLTVGALVVAADSQAFEFVALPSNDDESGLPGDFAKRRQAAAQAGVSYVQLFNYVIQTGNGYTSDYSTPEPVQATTAYRAGCKFLRKWLAQRSPRLVL